MSLSTEKVEALYAKLPEWAVTPHPTKKKMSSIHPMAVIERLNEVFGVGEWQTRVTFIDSKSFVQQTKNGPRDMFWATVKVELIVPDYSINLEQFGGSSNDDAGDALKGAATDALTKCASYLGIGAYIYNGSLERQKYPAPVTSSDIDLD